MNCCCLSLPDLAVVPMGGEGLDERVFATLDKVKDHGGEQWWLYLAKCKDCAQDWMVAQEERIYDDYFMRRLTPSDSREIIESDQWPDEFLTYERVLALGRAKSRPCVYLDPRSPARVETVKDLRRERLDISTDEIANLLGISSRNAISLLSPPTRFARLKAWISRG